jgi:hypothetical protein
MPFTDGQIAAIAHANDLVLITVSVKDFARFKGLKVSRTGSGRLVLVVSTRGTPREDEVGATPATG